MNNNQQKVIHNLIEQGQRHLRSPRQATKKYAGVPEADRLLNDLENYPHHFILACVMDRQMEATRAWVIPYKVGVEIDGFEFDDYLRVGLPRLRAIFKSKSLHRFNNVMAANFHSAIQDIHRKYVDDASAIWNNKPKSAAVIRRFLEFRGVGVKIANMATNLLARDFKVPMTDYSSIDIAPDVRVKRFFVENNLLRKNASNDELIYLARELFPEFPGILDYAAWRGGKQVRKSKISKSAAIPRSDSGF
jgi:endonuclease-3